MPPTALPTGAMTLVDLAKMLDPNDQVARIINILTQENQFLDDIQWIPTNKSASHQVTVQTSLPQGTYRMFNQGIPTTKGTTAQIEETCAMLEDYSQIDAALARLGGNEGAVRLAMARTHIEGLRQQFASSMFYGTAANPAEFVGLAARYSDPSAGNGDFILDGGGDGSDNTSIYLVSHGEDRFTGIYPQGSKAGLSHQDLGESTSENVNGVAGALMQVLRDHFKWDGGIAVHNYQCIVRIANIDVSDLESPSNAADLLHLMGDAEERLKEGGSRAFYCNRTIRRFLRHQTRASVGAGGGITFENVAGKRVMYFGETPVRLTDALHNHEEAVAFA